MHILPPKNSVFDLAENAWSFALLKWVILYFQIFTPQEFALYRSYITHSTFQGTSCLDESRNRFLLSQSVLFIEIFR